MAVIGSNERCLEIEIIILIIIDIITVKGIDYLFCYIIILVTESKIGVINDEFTWEHLLHEKLSVDILVSDILSTTDYKISF